MLSKFSYWYIWLWYSVKCEKNNTSCLYYGHMDKSPCIRVHVWVCTQRDRNRLIWNHLCRWDCKYNFFFFWSFVYLSVISDLLILDMYVKLSLVKNIIILSILFVLNVLKCIIRISGAGVIECFPSVLDVLDSIPALHKPGMSVSQHSWNRHRRREVYPCLHGKFEGNRPVSVRERK